MILAVDDDTVVTMVLVALLEQDGLEAKAVHSGRDALRALTTEPVDVVITDLRMPEMDGIELLRQVREQWPEIPVIVLTAHGSVPVAVEAMKAGAIDFMAKPFERDEVLGTVRRALAIADHRADRQSKPTPSSAQLEGESAVMRELLALLNRVARGTATILVQGETGTGKELAANFIHQKSPRSEGPFIVVDCAAVPENLLESHLFGHEKGAFTSASARKPGRVELAQGGVLFLDEVAEIPPLLQSKLLRLLQEKEIQPVGGVRSAKIDVRFVAATNRDLGAMVAAGQFREDLYYRLNVVPVHLPPLREHREDITTLARSFCRRICAANQLPQKVIAPPALLMLTNQPWPGNVRQLQNVIERLVLFNESGTINAREVEVELSRSPDIVSFGSELAAVNDIPADSPPSLAEQRRQAEREALATALERAVGNRTVAARLLGVSRRTLYNKLAEHGLD